eukprot:10484255-Ditylum_brightwellii.AAC.2
MSNITATNLNLTEQVASLTTKLSAKDEAVKALQHILDELTATMQAFSMASMMQQPGSPNIMPNMNMYNNAHPAQAFNPNVFLPQQQQPTPNSGFGQYQRCGGGCSQA